MKRHITIPAVFFFTSLFISSTAAQSTWTPQTSGTTETLTSVHLVDTMTGWAVGGNGTILHTTDGGATWAAQTSGTTEPLNEVHFVDALTGWASNPDGKLFYTGDGGATWSERANGLGTLRDLFFVDAMTGWASVERASILHTTDGGITWTPQSVPIPASEALFELYFLDANTGWAVGSGGMSVNTTDGGTTWNLGFTNQSSFLYGVHFADANIGWTVGRFGTILKTTDGGIIWRRQTSNTAADLQSVSFADALTGLAVGANGTILHTADGGITWTPQTSGTTELLLSIQLVDETAAWIVGANGVLLGGEVNAVEEKFARAQFVHAAADPAVEVVDVYFDNDLMLDDFTYRTGTAFMDVPAEQEITVGLAPGTSTSAADALLTFPVTFQEGSTYHAVAAGVLEPAQFSPNPDGLDTKLNLYLTNDAREVSSTAGEFQTRLFHALIDGPTFDFLVDDPGGAFVLHDNGSFGDFSGYASTSPSVKTGLITPENTHTEVIFSVVGDFTALADSALLELNIGFYEPDKSAMEWMWIFPDGTVTFLDVLVTDVEEASTEIPERFALLGNYPNPFNPVTTIQVDLPQHASVRLDVFDLLGRQVLSIPEHMLTAGAQRSLEVDATTLSSGLYLYRVTARMATSTKVATGQMVLLK